MKHALDDSQKLRQEIVSELRFAKNLALDQKDLKALRTVNKALVQMGWWPAPGSEDTELGVLMELEVGHGETEVYPRVQA